MHLRLPARASLVLALLLTAVVRSSGTDTSAFRVEPSPVTVGAFFNGGTLRVSGALEPGADVVVVIKGRTTKETYNRKGRMGPFWATVGKVTIADVPVLYLIGSRTPVATLLSPAAIDAHMVDLDALARRASVEPASDDRALLVGEYLKLKREQGVMGVFEDAVRIGGSAQEPAFEAAIPWPALAPVGTYHVVVRHVKNGAVVREDSQQLDVAYVGLPRLIAYLAFERSLAYGVFGVFVALTGGLVMGLVFKKGTAGH
jgi:uncharacterized protein (TIGR02186 family)